MNKNTVNFNNDNDGQFDYMTFLTIIKLSNHEDEFFTTINILVKTMGFKPNSRVGKINDKMSKSLDRLCNFYNLIKYDEDGKIIYGKIIAKEDRETAFKVMKDALKKLLLSLKVYEFNNRVNSFKFNDEIISENQTKDLEGTSSVYMTKELFDKICSEIEGSDISENIKKGNKMIEEYKKAKMNSGRDNVVNEVSASERTPLDRTPLELEETLDTSIKYIFIEKNNGNNKKSDSFKRFVEENFILNVDYTLILHKMKQLGIFKYALYNKKRVYIPSKMYEDKFYYVVTSTNNITGGLLIRDNSREFIANILKENNLISDK